MDYKEAYIAQKRAYNRLRQLYERVTYERDEAVAEYNRQRGVVDKSISSAKLYKDEMDKTIRGLRESKAKYDELNRELSSILKQIKSIQLIEV